VKVSLDLNMIVAPLEKNIMVKLLSVDQSVRRIVVYPLPPKNYAL